MVPHNAKLVSMGAAPSIMYFVLHFATKISLTFKNDSNPF